MKITKIEPQKNTDRVNIYINDKFAFGLFEEIRFKFGLKVDDEIEQEFIDNVLNSEEQKHAIDYALNYISYRQRSKKEVYNALRKKGLEENYIEYAIDYLTERSYLDDSSFADSFIRDKRNLNKYGSRRIEYELSAKGVSRETIHELLNYDTDEEYNMAMELASKKIMSYSSDDRNSVYRKLGGFLQRKGYNFDIVNKVLQEILDDRE